MSSTVGHGLCGLSILQAARVAHPGASFLASRRWMIAFVIFANLPDLDFVAGYIFTGDVHRFHSGPSHSLIFALLCTFIILPFVDAERRRTVAPWIGLAVLSHLVIDLFAGPSPGWQQSYGVPLFWPFDGQRIRVPFSLFFGVEHETIDKFLAVHNAFVVAVEVVTFGIPFLLLQRWARLRTVQFFRFREA